MRTVIRLGMRSVWFWTAIAHLTSLFWLTGALTLSSADASLLRTADNLGAIVVQSRRTLWDQNHHSWQVIAFKSVRPDRPDAETYLRLVGFLDQTEIAHPQPIALVGIGQVWMAADRSDQISTQISTAPQPVTLPANMGQYALEPILAELSPTQKLRLELPRVDQGAIVLQIPPALVEEWQQVSGSTADPLVNACELFPLEARQNPAFPDWTGCRTAASSLP